MKNHLNHIVSELVSGNLDAFKELYNLYHKRIYGFCINNGQSHHDAEEVLQEVFIKIWANRTEIDLDRNIESFLFSIAKNIIIDKYRKLVRSKAALEHQIYFLTPPNSTENDVLYNELQKEIQKTFDSMPELRKLVFQMSRFKGCSNDEIAEELGISMKSVENHISRALQNFRNELGHYSASVVYLVFIFLN